MKEKELIELFESCNSKYIDWVGQCHDCKKDIKVTAERTETIIDDKVKIDIKIDGGAVYSVDDKYYIKCPDCYNKETILRNFRPVETYSRCVGYYRPVNSWNDGKQAEFRNRKSFKLAEELVF